MFRQSMEPPLAQHAFKSFSYLSLPVKSESVWLRFSRSLQNFLHDPRFGIHNLIVCFDIEWFDNQTLITDSLLYSRGPSDGLIIIFDMRNVGMRHLLRPKIETLKYFFRYLQDALPAKLEAMHIVNCVSFFDMVLTLIKPFMKSEIIQKVSREISLWICYWTLRFRFTCIMEKTTKNCARMSCRGLASHRTLAVI